MRSPRNKTLDAPLEQCADYLARCAAPAPGLTPADCTDAFFCGDCFEVLPLLPAASADLLIADPPYNLRKDYGGEVFPRQTDEAYLSFTRRWLTQARRVLKPDASVYVCCDWRTSILMGGVLAEFFTVRSRITWQREKGRGAAKNWKNCLEDVWFCTVGEDYTFCLDNVKQLRRVKAPYRENGAAKDWQAAGKEKVRLTCPSNFWDDITVPFWSMAENTAHPTQKPEKLLAKMILASAGEQALVLDPFAGSGSAAVAAKKLGRHYCAIEKNPQYCAWAQIRLERAEHDRRIQGYENGVFLKN